MGDAFWKHLVKRKNGFKLARSRIWGDFPPLFTKRIKFFESCFPLGTLVHDSEAVIFVFSLWGRREKQTIAQSKHLSFSLSLAPSSNLSLSLTLGDAKTVEFFSLSTSLLLTLSKERKGVWSLAHLPGSVWNWVEKKDFHRFCLSIDLHILVSLRDN